MASFYVCGSLYFPFGARAHALVIWSLLLRPGSTKRAAQTLGPKPLLSIVRHQNSSLNTVATVLILSLEVL
jgi:hypothetical protein